MSILDRNLKTLEDELRVRAKQQAAVAELGQRALIGTGLDKLMAEMVVLVARTLDLEYCKVLELLPGGEALLLRAGVGWKEEYVGQAQVGAGSDSQAGYTLLSSEPVVVEDMRAETRFSGPQLLHEHAVISGMSVLISGRDRPFGVLGVHTRFHRIFNRHDINFLQSVANVLAAAIERKRVEAELMALNATLENRVAERTGYIRLLQEVAVAANGVTTVAEALQFTLDKVCEHTGWPVGHVYMPLEDATALGVAVSAQGRQLLDTKLPLLVSTCLWHLQDPSRFETFQRVTEATHFPADMGLPGMVFTTGQPGWFIDLARESHFIRGKLADNLVVKAGFAFPVLAGLVVVAVLEFFSEQVREPDESLLVVMGQIGAQLGRVVERKRAEAQLRSSQQQLAEAQKLAHIGSWDWNIPADRLSWSDELYRIFGLDPGGFQLTYQTFLEKIHQQDRELVSEQVNQAYRDHRPFEFTHRIHRPDGTERVIYGQGRVELDEDGRPVRMIGTGQDITERKQMETALHESLALLENLFESAPDGTVLVDDQGKILRLNRQMALLFGYERPELLGKSLEVLLPERFQERHIKHRRVYAGEAHLRSMGAGLELFGRRKDGSEFPVDIMLSPLQTEQGMLVICVVRDITQRKQAMEALRQSENRFRTIFEGAALGIALVDLDLRVLASNPRLQKALGYTDKELLGMSLAEQSPPEDEQLTRDSFAALIAGNEDHMQIEKRFICKDGKLAWANVTISLIRAADGMPQFAIHMVEDISARKQMETELAEVQHRLFAGREQERIHLAQELHDEPMQDLYAALYLLNDVDTISNEAERSEQLYQVRSALQQVIDTLRSICGELRSPTLVPFGLESAIREHAELFQNKYPELSVNLNLMADGQTLPEQMRVNLFRIYQQAMSNIFRHAQASQVFVRFRWDEEDVVLEVEDDGRGFIASGRWIDLARRGHLGLAGSAERAEMFGGKFHVRSTPEKGTLIKVVLPRQIRQARPYLIS